MVNISLYQYISKIEFLGKPPATAHISLISFLWKLLEKYLLLMWYLVKEQKVSSIQAGFGKLKSETDPIVELDKSKRSNSYNSKRSNS